MPVTMRQIASAAGVSRPVVSAVLSGSSATIRVSTEKADRIRRIALELGYQKQWRSSVMTGGRTRLVGLLAPPPLSGIQHDGSLVSGLCDCLRQRGLTLAFAPAGDDEGEAMLDGRFDGCLLDFVVSSERTEMLRRNNLPGVILNAEPRDGIPAVRLDEGAAMLAAVEHLTSLGHVDICYVDNKPVGEVNRVNTGELGRRRLAAWEHAVAALGPSLRPRRCAMPSTRYNDMRDAVNRTGVEAMLDEPRGIRPTAFVCHNASIALCLAQAFDAWGVGCPADVSLLSMEDASALRLRPAPITAVMSDFYELGRVAANRLADLIDEVYEPQSASVIARDDTLIRSQLIIRRSTGVVPDEAFA